MVMFPPNTFSDGLIWFVGSTVAFRWLFVEPKPPNINPALLPGAATFD